MAVIRAARGGVVRAMVIVLCVSFLGSAASAQAEPQVVLYRAPVPERVVDSFRPPAHIGAPGNRGLEYGNPFGRHVFAAADGVVAFAGQVAGRGVITLQHPDGIRTTYTGLGEIWVDDGEPVEQGWTMGAAAGRLHFGARILDHYLDPQLLIDASQVERRPRLVPPNNGN